MKIFLILLCLNSAILANEEKLILSRNTHTGCTIPFFENKQKNCVLEKKTKKKPKSHKVSTNYKKQLKTILKDVQAYKHKSQNEIQKLHQQLEEMKKEFHQYKLEKEKKAKKRPSKKKSLQTKKPKQVHSPKMHSKKLVSKQHIPKNIVNKKTVPTPMVIQVPQEPLPKVKHLPWIEVVIENDINIYQLALLYYGNRNKYREIYAANQNIIAKDFQINNGMSLKIPISLDFEEQPMFLNTQ